MSTYRFNDYLRVLIEDGGRRAYSDYFENEYARISAERDEPTCKAAIQVIVVDRLPQPRAGLIVRKVSFKKLFTYEFAVDGIDTDLVRIYFKSHPVDRIYPTAVGVYLQAHVLEPIIYLKLLEQDVLFMHGAGVSKGSRAYVFPAEGGTGKTSLSISLVHSGYSLLGDDLLMIDSRSMIVYPYQRPLHIFDYNVRGLYGAHMPLRLKAVVYAKNVLRYVLERALKTEFLISTRVHAEEILPGLTFSHPCRLAKVLFLKKTGRHSADDMANEERRLNLAREIIDSGDLNRSLYDLLDDQGDVRRIRQVELKTAERILMNAESVGWLNARSLDLEQPEELISLIER